MNFRKWIALELANVIINKRKFNKPKWLPIIGFLEYIKFKNITEIAQRKGKENWKQCFKFLKVSVKQHSFWK